MKELKWAGFPSSGDRKVVSRTDAVLLMVASAAAAASTLVLTVDAILGFFTGPVTLTLPLATKQQSLSGLRHGAEAHFTALEATIPTLPHGKAALLAWAGALNEVGILAVLSLLFLLAFRLRAEKLFTQGSVWIIGACGAVLAVAGTVGQMLDSAARNGLADLIGANQPTDEAIIFMGEFNIGPMIAGIVLILVAGVFQFGRRLQKDTEGLV